jgi:hypothetical protein
VESTTADLPLSGVERWPSEGQQRGSMPRDTPLFSREDVTVIEFKRRDSTDTNTKKCCLCGYKIKKSEIGYYSVTIRTKDGPYPDVAHRRCIKEG